MHCPNCGKETSADVKFCRVCGMKLDSVARAVSEHTGSEYELEPAEKRGRGSVGRKTVNTIFAGFVLVILGAVTLAFGKEVPWAKTAGIIFALLGMLVTVYAVLYPAARNEAKAPRRTPAKKEMETNSVAELPAGDDFVSATPVPSVTEATTRDLDGKKTKVAR